MHIADMPFVLRIVCFSVRSFAPSRELVDEQRTVFLCVKQPHFGTSKTRLKPCKNDLKWNIASVVTVFVCSQQSFVTALGCYCHTLVVDVVPNWQIVYVTPWPPWTSVEYFDFPGARITMIECVNE